MARRRSVDQTVSRDPGFKEFPWGRALPPERVEIGSNWFGTPPSLPPGYMGPTMNPYLHNPFYAFRRHRGKFAVGGVAALVLAAGGYFGFRTLSDVDTCTTHTLVGESGQTIEFCVEENAVFKSNGVVTAEVTVKAGETGSNLGSLDSSLPPDIQELPVRSSAFILQAMLAEGREDGPALCLAENQDVINMIKNNAGYYENYSESVAASVRKEEIVAATTIQLVSRVTLPGTTEPKARVLEC